MRELTDFDTQKMHMQMVGKASFKEVIGYREMLRRRRINKILWAIVVLGNI